MRQYSHKIDKRYQNPRLSQNYATFYKLDFQTQGLLPSSTPSSPILGGRAKRIEAIQPRYIKGIKIIDGRKMIQNYTKLIVNQTATIDSQSNSHKIYQNHGMSPKKCKTIQNTTKLKLQRKVFSHLLLPVLGGRVKRNEAIQPRYTEKVSKSQNIASLCKFEQTWYSNAKSSPYLLPRGMNET